MAKLVLVKDDCGDLVGLSEKDRRGYDKWLRHICDMELGELVTFDWKAPRSLKFHQRFFVMLGKLFERQEAFVNPDDLRAWLIVGAGECTFLPGRDGMMCAVPKSIAFEAMDDIEFSELVRKVDQFLWSDHARAVLWPHLSRKLSFEAVEQLMLEMERSP